MKKGKRKKYLQMLLKKLLKVNYKLTIFILYLY